MLNDPFIRKMGSVLPDFTLTHNTQRDIYELTGPEFAHTWHGYPAPDRLPQLQKSFRIGTEQHPYPSLYALCVQEGYEPANEHKQTCEAWLLWKVRQHIHEADLAEKRIKAIYISKSRLKHLSEIAMIRQRFGSELVVKAVRSARKINRSVRETRKKSKIEIRRSVNEISLD